MTNNFEAENWQDYIPIPVNDKHPEYIELYNKTWELAHEHIKTISGMPQSPYMDEAFCATQIWIWDTCFMSLFCKYARDVFPGVESLKNFYDVLYEGKRLPKIIPPNDEPEWTGAIPGIPYEMVIHIADNPPLFAWAEYENALFKGDYDYIKDLLNNKKVLQKHYDWIENLHAGIKPDGVLHHTHLIAEKDGYKWEGGISGMDNTPRGRTGEHADKPRPNNPDMLWIDALCQQALSAQMIAKLYSIIGDRKGESEWTKKYETKKNMINKLYWDDKDGFYYDIDCNTHDFYKVKSIASFWTLISGAASIQQAKTLVQHVSDSDTFGGVVPLVSLARNDNDFVSNGKYWRGAVWLPTAYMVLKGMARYGFYSEARSAAEKVVEHMYKTYIGYEPHTIWECYNPEKPEPSVDPYETNDIVRKDFCGWSALGPISVYIEFILGFHEINAFDMTVKWAKPVVSGEIGIKNLRFGGVVTDITANGNICSVSTNKPYTLEINGRNYGISVGNNIIEL